MKTHSFLSVILILLLVTSVTVPTATASTSASGFVPAAAAPFVVPATTEMVIHGISVIMAGASALLIATYLDHRYWERSDDGWNKLMKDCGNELTKQFPLHTREPPKWRDVMDDDKVTSLLISKYECYGNGGGSGPKKDDKWYFVARINKGKMEIDTNHQLTEEEAVKEMHRGKNILTVNKKLAQNVVGRFKGLSEQGTKDLQFESSTSTRGVAEEWYEHLHYDAKGMRLHCWVWRHP